MAIPTFLTADEFLVHPAAQEASELVRGEIRMMTPAGGRHGVVAGRVYRQLGAHVDAHALGLCFGDNIGYRLPIPGGTRDTVRAPDASFVAAGRLTLAEVPRGFIPLAPDLVVEVLSPDQTAADVDERMADYVAAGTRLFWVVDSDRRTVAVHAHDAPPHWLGADDRLDGGDVIPGFSLPVHELFAGLGA